MKYKCPVCGYRMPFPPEDNNICSSCGTEFGYDDARKTYTQIRQEWIMGGAKWFSDYATRPLGWNPWMQLILAGYDVPFHAEFHSQQPVIVGGKANLTSGYVVQLT